MKNNLLKYTTKALAVISLTALSMGNASAASQYTFTDLGTLEGYRDSSATAINDLGQIVGYVGQRYGNQRAFLYEAGAMQALAALDGIDSKANDINNHGQIVGYTADRKDDAFSDGAFIYENVTMKDLGLGRGSQAYGINENGDIVGSYWTSGENLSSLSTSYLLKANGTIENIQSAGDPTIEEAVAVNNSGLVVGGWYDYHHGGSGTYTYQNGQLEREGSVYYGRVADVNDNGVILGNNEVFDAYIIKNGELSYLTEPLSGKFSSYMYAINDKEQMTGKGYLYENGEFFNLNDLVIGDLGGWKITETFDINELGQIVGNATHDEFGRHAVLLNPVSPVPEPATGLMFAPALLGLAALRRKQKAQA